MPASRIKLWKGTLEEYHADPGILWEFLQHGTWINSILDLILKTDRH